VTQSILLSLFENWSVSVTVTNYRRLGIDIERQFVLLTVLEAQAWRWDHLGSDEDLVVWHHNSRSVYNKKRSQNKTGSQSDLGLFESCPHPVT
jgi:hypothetical protein